MRRATGRATRAAVQRSMNVTERAGRDSRHGDARWRGPAGGITRSGSTRKLAAPAMRGRSPAPGPHHSTGTPPGSAAVSVTCRAPDVWSAPYAGDRGPHRPSGPGFMPGHAGDPGTVSSAREPHHHLHISHDRAVPCRVPARARRRARIAGSPGRWPCRPRAARAARR